MKAWVAAGQSYREFWGLTLRDVDLILRAAGEARLQKFKAARALNYELAALVRVGHHDPKKFPKYDDFMGVKAKAKHQPEHFHAYLMALAQRSAARPKPKG